MFRTCLTLVFIFLLSITAFASDGGFETEEKTVEEMEELYDLYTITPLDQEPLKRKIVHFDVYEDGSFAIGSEEDTIKYISVYSAEKEFLYGFRFYSNGDFAIELHQEYLSVYFVRGNYFVDIKPDGEVISYKIILDTANNNAYWRNVLNNTERKFDEKTYTIQGRELLAFPSYSQLVVTDSAGAQEVLYESTEKFEPNIVAIVGVAAVVCYSCCSIAIRLQKKKKNNQENRS